MEEYLKNGFDIRYLHQVFYDYGQCKISKRQLMDYLKGSGKIAKLIHENHSLYKHMKDLRQDLISHDRNLEVVYITGASGTGKTTAAKWLAEKLHYDYFVSGSGEDILDGYDKEECIILDDYRASVMSFSELLKFLDNHTNSSVKSRFKNKDISMCKLIIITSIYPPEELYVNIAKSENQEPLEQLLRRLKHKHYEVVGGSLWQVNQSGVHKEIVTIAEVKSFLNIVDSEDDVSIIDTLISAEESYESK